MNKKYNLIFDEVYEKEFENVIHHKSFFGDSVYLDDKYRIPILSYYDEEFIKRMFKIKYYLSHVEKVTANVERYHYKLRQKKFNTQGLEDSHFDFIENIHRSGRAFSLLESGILVMDAITKVNERIEITINTEQHSNIDHLADVVFNNFSKWSDIQKTGFDKGSIIVLTNVLWTNK